MLAVSEIIIVSRCHGEPREFVIERKHTRGLEDIAVIVQAIGSSYS